MSQLYVYICIYMYIYTYRCIYIPDKLHYIILLL